MNTVNDNPFLKFLDKKYKTSGEEFLNYSPWGTDNNLYYQTIDRLDFNSNDISIFKESTTAIEAIIKCYDSDNTILFYLLSTQIMNNNSNVPPVFVYNYLTDENGELSDYLEESPYLWLSDVSVYLFRTQNNIFVFQNTSDWVQGFLININAEELSETISQLFLKYITTKITKPNQLLEIANQHYSTLNDIF